MTDFLLIFQNGDPNWMEGKSPEEVQARLQAWAEWFKQLEAVRQPAQSWRRAGQGWRSPDAGTAPDSTRIRPCPK